MGDPPGEPLNNMPGTVRIAPGRSPLPNTFASLAGAEPLSTTHDTEAPVRATDPITSLIAATRAKNRVTVARAIETVLAAKGEPMTADAIWATLRTEYGFYCSHERVRTVLNEGAGLSKRVSARFNSFRRTLETAPSENGNPSHLWTLAGEA